MAGPPDNAGSLAARIAETALFDSAWVATQLGLPASLSRLELAHHYLSADHRAVSPHPLFEPGWLYPGDRWRGRAPDPLTWYLHEGTGGPAHPLAEQDLDAGYEDWVARLHDDTELPQPGGGTLRYGAVRAAALAAIAPPPPPTPEPLVPGRVTVALLDHSGPRRLVTWMRRLRRAHLPADPELEILVVTSEPGPARLGATVGLTVAPSRTLRLPSGAGAWTAALTAAAGEVIVWVSTALEPPLWPFVPQLCAALRRDDATAVPLLLADDFTIWTAGLCLPDHGAAPFLRGQPVDDAELPARHPVPAPWPGVLAARTAPARELPVAPSPVWEIGLARALGGPTLLVPQARVLVPAGVPDPAPQALAEATRGLPVAPGGWELIGLGPPPGPGARPLRAQIDQRPPALRWCLDIAAPAAPRGRLWGDYHFARSLGSALERLGQRVVLDHPETRGRASRDLDDVVCVIRGLDPVPVPTSPRTRLIWVISHPDTVTAAELAGYDRRFAAGSAWAEHRSRDWRLPIQVLPQCTDPERFHPDAERADTGPEVLFVGNVRNSRRPLPEAALAAGLGVVVYGDGWSGIGEHWHGRHVPNHELGRLYASAGVVLADHWPDMRANGFISNRVFDVLACAGRLVTDEVSGLAEILPGAPVRTVRDPDEVRFLAEPGWRASFPKIEARRAFGAMVIRDHSFDTRAHHLLDAALQSRARPVDSTPCPKP